MKKWRKRKKKWSQKEKKFRERRRMGGVLLIHQLIRIRWGKNWTTSSHHTHSPLFWEQIFYTTSTSRRIYSLSLSQNSVTHLSLSLSLRHSIQYYMPLYCIYIIFCFGKQVQIFFSKAHPLREATLRVWDPSEKAWLQLQLRKWFLGFVFQPRSLISFYLHLFYFSLNYMIMMINLLLLLSVCGMS